MECFCSDLTASATAKLLKINRNTINAYFKEFRIKILEDSIKIHNKDFAEFELDESYFGAKRIRDLQISLSYFKTRFFKWIRKNSYFEHYIASEPNSKSVFQ